MGRIGLLEQTGPRWSHVADHDIVAQSFSFSEGTRGFGEVYSPNLLTLIGRNAPDSPGHPWTHHRSRPRAAAAAAPARATVVMTRTEKTH